MVTAPLREHDKSFLLCDFRSTHICQGNLFPTSWCYLRRGFRVAVPRFNHELPALRRKGSFSWSMIIHAVGITLMLTAAHWLPQGHLEQPKLQVVTLYTPQIETAPVPKVVPPPPQLLAKLSP